jgi:ABC-2 type transport system permease protein
MPLANGPGIALARGFLEHGPKYLKTAAMSATSIIGDSPLFMLDYLLRVLRVLVLLSLWRVVLGEGEQASGLTLCALLTYTLIAEAFADPLNTRTNLDTALWEGSIATRFLRPMNLYGQFIAETVGRWVFGFAVFSVPLLLVAPLMGVNPLPASATHGLLFVLSLVLGVSVGLAIEFIFAAIIVRMESSVWAVDRMRAAISTLLSGALVPLPLLPWNLGEVFGWLPFAAMASAPLRIYTGTGDPRVLLAVQLGWSVLLWPVAVWSWRANRQRLVSYGG